MQTVVGMGSSLWMKKGSGLYAPSRRRFPINGLVLYAPLWHPELSGSPIISKDLNAHSCTVVGAPWGSQGRIFAAGDDYIDCGTGASLNLVQEFSIEVWFKYDATGSAEMIITKANDSSYPYFAWQLIKTNAEKIFLRGSNGVDAATLILTSDTALTADTFYHIIATYDKNAGNGIIYRNGVADGSGAISGTIPDNATKHLVLGVRPKTLPAFDSSLTGTIGEVRIYNRILTPAEVFHNYQSTKWRYV